MDEQEARDGEADCRVYTDHPLVVEAHVEENSVGNALHRVPLEITQPDNLQVKVTPLHSCIGMLCEAGIKCTGLTRLIRTRLIHSEYVNTRPLVRDE